MRQKKYNWIKRLLAIVLVTMTILQGLPTGLFENVLEVTAATVKPGDVNSDGRINAMDVTLMRRHITGGYNVTINTDAADVNADGNINAMDVTLLRRYIAGGYGVELKSAKKETEQIDPSLFLRTVKFETGGGAGMANKYVTPGTAISSFDTPVWAEHIFLGWCYDSALTQPVESDAKVTKDMTLYANWLEQAPLDTLETVSFASAVDVNPSFAINVVTSDLSLTAEDVLALITAEDITDPDAEDIITISGANGHFLVRGTNGFRAGASYRITLNNNALNFKDQPETAREYNFTVYREEVMNLTMQGDIVYLTVGEVGNIINNGEQVATLNLALYQTDGTSVSPADLVNGSFDYEGSKDIQEGTIVCIYEGAIPTERTKDTPKDQLGDMAYLEITGVSGETYTYTNAEAEDILFMPDVLPMPVNADTDSDASTITVENKYLDYSADMYAEINLDSQTTVDVGDFLVFYTGDYSVRQGENAPALVEYGKIISIDENDNDTTTIAYVVVAWNEIESSMSLHSREEMTGDDLLEGVDIERMESEIAQQALESGFAEEAAMYMASLALATDNFTALSENINVDDYKVTLATGETVSPEDLQLMAGSGVEVSVDDYAVSASIATRPTHLGNIEGTQADEKGLAISLDVMVVLSIAAAGADGKLEITITGSFIEEVGVDFVMDGDAVWETIAGFIPYIAEYEVTANVDVMNYTGVSFNATMVTKEADDDDDDALGKALNMAEEIKDLLSSMTNNAEESNELQNKLVQRYSEMINAESDWIEIVRYNIVNVESNQPFGIPLMVIIFQVDFVVQMDASISVGFDFEYLEGKRYSFTVEVLDKNVYTDTIDLVAKTYQFCFYAMGRVGLKAGVEMAFKIAIFSDSFAAVGVDAGAGAYTNLWGYFFYELLYSASQGKRQSYSGALLVEIGIYLQAGLSAEAIGGMFSARHILLDKEWKLWEAGRRDNVLDFVLEQEEIPEMVMKQHVREVRVPEDFFNMDYLDLKSGDGKTAIYNDWNDPLKEGDFRNGENYVITMTNDKFSYDPETNIVTVTPGEGDLKVEGEMVITWKQKPMSFSSSPIQRSIPLYWDNFKDGYFIIPMTNGGSYIPMIIAKYEAKVTAPADPERLGYEFAGWYSDAELTIPYTFPEKMPASDAYVYAKWDARTDIPYTVEHYQEQFRSGDYELVETENFVGTTDTYVTPGVKNYTGFVSPATAELKVEADGSAVLRYYYSLERHTVTFDSGKIDGVDVTSEKDVTYTLKYGAKISAPQMAVSGYTFAGWTVDGSSVATVAETMNTEDLTYTAMWEKKNDTEYRVEYYVQQADGRYTLQYMFKDKTGTGETFSASYLRGLMIDGVTAEEKFTQDNAIVFENMTVKGNACDIATVDGNGKTVIKVNYGREMHTLTFDLNYPGSNPIVKELFYDADVIVPQNVSRTGYTFIGWDETPVTTMPANSLTYKALWMANSYIVQFDKNHVDATGTMDDMTFTYDVPQNLTSNGFERLYYNFTGWATERAGAAVYQNGVGVSNLTPVLGGAVTLYATWAPVEYEIIYDVQGGTHTNPSTYNVETETITLTNPVRTGYTFDGWYTNNSYDGDKVEQIIRGSNGTINLYAKWIANTDTTYKVEHYLEQLDGTYSLVDTDNLTGTTDDMVAPSLNEYTGFTSPMAQNVTINGDGTLVVKYYYTRNTYTIYFDTAGGNVSQASIAVRYGDSFELPTATREGYGFNGWYKDGVAFNDTIMGAEDLVLVADWIAGQQSYTVNHYQQNVDGNGYTLVSTIPSTALMDAVVTPNMNSYEGFTASGSAITITIKADAKQNVVNYYYNRNQYNLTWNFGIGNAEGYYTVGPVYYGANITVPQLVKTGYSYTWDMEPVTKMPAYDLAYTAQWTVNDYKVSFNTNGGTVFGDGDVAQRIVSYGAVYGPLADMIKLGYTFDGWYDGDTKITADTLLTNASDHTLEAKFTPVTYTINYYNVESGEHTNPSTYTVLSAVGLLNPTRRTGFTFGGWYESSLFEGEPVAQIEVGTAGNKNYYANWIENTYSVTFHAGNGTSESNTKQLLYRAILGENTFNRAGYTFVGWSDGVNTYGVGTSVSQIVGDSMEAIHLTAVWEKQKYTITYENVTVEECNEFIKEYTVEDAVSLSEPARTGYTFVGWFDNSNFGETSIETINKGSTGNKTFYAKWMENQYKVVLKANDETDNSYPEMLYYSGNISINTFFERNGYTFMGWTTSPNGEKVYDDGVAVSDIIAHANGDNQVTLYAVWEPNVYTITYNLGKYAMSSEHGNPTSYSIKTGEDIVLADLQPQSGFYFGGWYTDEKCEGAKITTISFQGEINYTLYARWEHGGEFNISTDKPVVTSDSSGYNVTYTVTRTIPDGAFGTTDPQIVYVRTVNGTAYGNTPEAATGSQQDKYHFIHVNPTGEGSGMLTFGSKDTKKTFTIKEKDKDNNDYMAASYQSTTTKRYYNVEIYKVLDSTGKCQGTIGNNKSVKKNIEAGYYNVSDFYNATYYDYFKHTHYDSVTIFDENGALGVGNGAITSDTFVPANVYRNKAPQYISLYNDLASNGYHIDVSYTIQRRSGNSSFVMSLLDADTYKSLNSSTVKPELDQKTTYNISCDVANNQSIKAQWKMSNSSFSSYSTYTKKGTVSTRDTKAPTQQGIAPMALTEYKTGDSITFTVIYNEVVHNASGLSFTLPSGLSGKVSNVTYQGGAGTNALVFTGTVTSAFTIDTTGTVTNTTFVNHKTAVSGTVKDYKGNN